MGMTNKVLLNICFMCDENKVSVSTKEERIKHESLQGDVQWEADGYTNGGLSFLSVSHCFSLTPSPTHTKMKHIQSPERCGARWRQRDSSWELL